MADAEFILRPIVVPQAAGAARPLLDRIHDWIVTVDHKRLGLMYVFYGILFLVVAGLEAKAMRIQLALPNNHFVSPQVFNQLFTMHGTTMVFLVGMPLVFGFALSADLLAMALLAASSLLIDSPEPAYVILLAATGSLGFGFGAAVMALNSYAQKLSPGREDRSVLTLNALLGAGTALAPLLVAIFVGAGAWWLMPLMVAAALTGLLLLSTRQPLDVPAGREAGAPRSERLPRRFWLFAGAVLLYGVAETLNGNWSGPYLTGERGVSVRGASVALMTFWAMVTIGRVLFATVSSRTTVRWIYAGLPLLLLAAFQIVARAGGEAGSIAAFGLAGLGCSAFFPLCISLSGQESPRCAAAMSGGLVAFYQAGYGVAAFGVGPLREFAGLPFRTIYSLGSVVAPAMFALALAVTVRPMKGAA
jgi:fucose permease